MNESSQPTFRAEWLGACFSFIYGLWGHSISPDCFACFCIQVDAMQLSCLIHHRTIDGFYLTLVRTHELCSHDQVSSALLPVYNIKRSSGGILAKRKPQLSSKNCGLKGKICKLLH